MSFDATTFAVARRGNGSGGSSGQRETIPVTNFGTAVRMVAEGDPLTFPAHNGSMILCATEANDATFADRHDVTRYLIPIPANADRIEVETTDEQVTLMQFVGVKGTGGSYTQVFASPRGAARVYTFEKGAADYIAINMIYEDTAAISVPWEYDATATTTITFSAAVATGGAPADWNASEGEAGYVKNRTHWEEDKEVVEYLVKDLDLSTITHFAMRSGNVTMPVTINPEPDVVYYIDYNGQTASTVMNGDGILYFDTPLYSPDYPDSNPLRFDVGYFGNNVLGVAAAFDVTRDWTGQTASIYTKAEAHEVHHLDPKYIKDMYYEEDGTVTFVDNETLTGFAEMGNGIYEVQTASDWIHIEVGKTYTVVWDGESYECECIEVEGTPYLGNPNYFMMQTGGDYPFAWFCMGTGYLVTEQTSESHTVTIIGPGTIVHHLDPKYIKDMYCDTLSSRASGSILASGCVDGSSFDTVEISDEAKNYILGITCMASPKFMDLTINGATKRFEAGVNGVNIFENYRKDVWDDGYETAHYLHAGTAEWDLFILQRYELSNRAEPEWSVVIPNPELLKRVFGLDSYGDSTEISFTIYDGEFKKIDPKYLPDGVGGGSTVFYTPNDIDTVIYLDADCNNPAYSADVERAIKSGAIYIFKINTYGAEEGMYNIPTAIWRASGGYLMDYRSSDDSSSFQQVRTADAAPPPG